MPKPKMSREEEIKSKRSLPDVLELKFEGCMDAVLLLEELAKIKGQIGTKPDEKKGKEGSGWLAQEAQIKQKLSAIMAVEGLTGLRHNNLVFSDVWMEGRASTPIQDLKIELVQAGVDLGLVNECIAKVTKTGDGYARRVLTDLDKPRSGWDD